jgi:transcriptional regulator with XRE-family HTH domain
VARLKKSDIISLNKDKGLRQNQIAKLSGYSEGRISQILQEHKTNPDYIAFKDQKADILEGLQANIIDSIEPEDIKKASLQQKIISTSVLQDKIEQIRGVTQSMTDNQINILINNVINNYVANNNQPADIIDVEDIPPEIANNLNEL